MASRSRPGLADRGCPEHPTWLQHLPPSPCLPGGESPLPEAAWQPGVALGACNPVCSSALARLGASASRACVGCQDTQTDLFLFPGNNPKSSSKSPGEADGQGLREVLEFAATVFLSVGLGLGWGTARHLLSQANAALCFLFSLNSVKCEV